MGKKSETKKRVEQVIIWLSAGVSFQSICENMIAKYPIEKEDAEVYISKAFKSLRKERIKSKEDSCALHLKIRKDILRKYMLEFDRIRTKSGLDDEARVQMMVNLGSPIIEILKDIAELEEAYDVKLLAAEKIDDGE